MVLNITAFILAGGKSSRMGTDKGLVELNSIPMIQYVLQTVNSVFHKVIIISNNPAYKHFGVEVIADEIKDIGPLGGIITGMKNSETDWNFFIACDLPYMSKEIIELILLNANDCDAVIPVHQNKPEPLCALYNIKEIIIFENSVNEKDFKIQNVYNKLNHKLVEIPDSFFYSGNPFRNINSMKDLFNSHEL